MKFSKSFVSGKSICMFRGRSSSVMSVKGGKNEDNAHMGSDCR